MWCSASLIACLIRTISTYRLPWGRSTSSGSELAKSNNCFPAALGASIWPFSVTHPVSSWLLFVALGCSRLLSAFFFTRSSVFLFPSPLLSQTSARFQHTNHLRTHALTSHCPDICFQKYSFMPFMSMEKGGKTQNDALRLKFPMSLHRKKLLFECSSNAPRMLLECSSIQRL